MKSLGHGPGMARREEAGQSSKGVGDHGRRIQPLPWITDAWLGNKQALTGDQNSNYSQYGTRLSTRNETHYSGVTRYVSTWSSFTLTCLLRPI